MKRKSGIPLVVIDLLGGAVVAGCLIASATLIAARLQSGESVTAAPARMIEAAQRDLAALNAAVDRQRAIVEQRRVELEVSGQLPDRTPTEAYFRKLSELAREHHVRVISSKPVFSREYPGLLEQRYAYDVAGPTIDLLSFLRAIETTEFWADVSYLQIQAGRPVAGSRENDRVASMTLSLFSVAPQEPELEASDG